MKTVNNQTYYSITDVARMVGIKPDLLWQKVYYRQDKPLPKPTVTIGFRRFYDQGGLNSLLEAIAQS